MRHPSATTLALFALTGTLTAGAILAQKAPPAAVAPAGPIQITLPFNKAIVRESVPIRLREFPKGGYVAVSIDGRFVTAQALPASPRDPVYVWDTKAGYAPADAPDTVSTYNDGPHALTVVVYSPDPGSHMVGSDSVSVQLSNKINLPSGQGITLTYPWKTNRDLRYQRRTELTAASTDAAASVPAPPIQESRLRFARSVENATGGEYLVRDEIIPVDHSARPKPFVSYVATRGSVVPLAQVRAFYRTVNARGQVLADLTSENHGNSIGFSIPVLPPRRVSVGAHWETPVKITLDWASPTPATVTATSTLEGFEWQDRYPTAKIRETYAGPALFRPAPGSPLPPLAGQDIKFERVIYFAYNAGRIVRMQTTLSLTTNTPGLLSLGASSGFGGGYPGGGYPGGGFGGGYPGGFPGGGGYPGGGFPSAMRRGGFDGAESKNGFGGYPGGGFPGGGGYPGGGFGGGYPGGGFGGGYPGGGFPGGGFAGGAANPNAATKLVYTETTVVI